MNVGSYTNGDGFSMPVPVERNGNGNGHGPKLPPHDVHAERATLGCMLLDNATIDDVMTVLNPGDFYRPAHAIICRAVYALRDCGKPVDTILLGEELRRSGDFERVGGLDYLLDLMGVVPYGIDAVAWSLVVRGKAVKREGIEVANQILRAGHDDSIDGSEFVEELERAAFAVSDGRAKFQCSTAAEATAESLVAIDRRRQTNTVPGLRSGLVDLDEILGGIEGAQLVVIGARPRMGKTALAVQWASFIAEKHRKAVLFISLEMSRRELADRMLSMVGEVHGSKLRFPRNLTGADLAALEAAQARIADYATLEIDDTPEMSASLIASHARKVKAKHGLGVIFVDYLQLVRPDNPRDPRHEQIASVSRRLKTLSRELDVPVVALAQLNRDPEKRDDQRPRLADLRESGQIEQDAHAVIMLHRPELADPNDQPGIAEAIVVKNRNGPMGTARLCFRDNLTRFETIQADY